MGLQRAAARIWHRFGVDLLDARYRGWPRDHRPSIEHNSVSSRDSSIAAYALDHAAIRIRRSV